MDGFSLDIKQEQIVKLKELFPEVFSEDKIDWERLRATLGEDAFISNERYVLNWAGKSDAFRTLQTGTSATLVPVEVCLNGEFFPFSVDNQVNEQQKTDNGQQKTDNIFIEGENLEVLKVLQKPYFGKIKCIVIDPPYNTGSDSFIYPDKFSETKEEYMQRVGDKDEEGYLMKEGLFRKNSKENGQYHSNWLSMMYPRLFLARNLLKDDGVIFVHIDDNEVHNLRLLMNEIFGEDNFVANVIWHKKYASANDVKGFSEVHDYIIVFQKSELFNRNLLPRTDKQNNLYKYDDNDGKGLWRTDNLSVKTYSKEYDYPVENPKTMKIYYPPKGRCWLTNKNTLLKWIEEGRVFFGKDENGAPQLKRYLNEVQQGIVPITYWSYNDCGHNDESRKEIKNLFENPPFDTPKPTRLIKRILQIASVINTDDIILDFFAGSGTTAHAVLELNKEDGGNRKFILVQLPEKTDENSDAHKDGYLTIADICKERIRRVIKKIVEENNSKEQQLIEDTPLEIDLGFKVFKLSPTSFKQWRTDIQTVEELEEQIDAFTDQIKPESEEINMLYELLLKSGFDLTSKIDVRDLGLGTYFYVINDGELVLQLSGMPEKTVDSIIESNPRKVLMLDRLFENNDQLKTNTFLQFKDSGVDFRTV
jgi:adenine-specific DNA-methyltransferase